VIEENGGNKMRRKNLLGAILCSVSLVTAGIAPQAVMADTAAKVVTLGADLSDAQKQSMLNYFKVNADEVEILYVTNSDEVAYLSSSVPLSQIGTRTVSCAYVKPTTSGGIKVRTANLNYVTCNMIATTLSTSGVKNCEVVAACPFEVSGTGALTGITMAYEKATGEELDARKKQTAVKEMVVTGDLADTINSSNDAINIINSGKMEVIGNDIQNADEIYNVVVNIVNQNNVSVPEEQIDEIVSLLEEIADQDYDYEDMAETLENVEANVSGDALEAEENGEEQTETDEDSDEDSILDDLDSSALGDEVFESSTEDPALEVQTANEEAVESGSDEEWEVFDDGESNDGDDDVWYEENSDEFPDEEGEEAIEGEELYPVEDTPEVINEDEVFAEDPDEELNTDTLDDTQRGMYDHLQTFCKGDYEGDLDSYQFEMGAEEIPSVSLDAETAEKLTKDVLKMYLELLKDGTVNYVPSESDVYLTPELNMIQDQLEDILLLKDDVILEDTDSYMKDVSELDRQMIFDDTMKFFEKLYNETSSESYEDDSVSEESYEESYDESYEDE
jgi:uncharacterized protein YpuA (DUF1002 family)